MTDYYCDASMPDDTGAGTSWATAKKTFVAGVALLGAGDTLYLAAGTYPLAAKVQLPNAAIVSVLGYTGDPEDVILDLSGIGADHGLWVTGVACTGMALKYMTFKGLTAANKYAINIADTPTSPVITRCKWLDNEREVQVVTDTTFEFCEFSGVIDASWRIRHADTDATFNYCIFRGSPSYLGQGIALNVTDGSDYTVTFNNCLVTGSMDRGVNVINTGGGNDLTVVFRNCAFFGNGYNGAIQGSWNITGACSNVTFEHSSAIKAVVNTNNQMLDDEITPMNSLTDLPHLRGHTRQGMVILSVDDAGHWDYAYGTFAPACEAHNWKFTFYCNTGGMSNNVTPSELKAFLEAGHEIGSHSQTHSDLADTEFLTVDGPAGATITISCTQNMVSPAASPSTGWMGTLTCKEGVAVVGTFDLAIGGDYETVTDLAAGIDALAGWTCSVIDSAANTNAYSICLADVTDLDVSAATNLSFDQTEFLWLEVTESKYLIEQYVSATGYGSYTVESFAAPYNRTSETLVDAIKAAGYTGARCAYNALNEDVHQLSDFAIFAMKSLALSCVQADPAGGDYSPSEKFTRAVLAWAAELGACLPIMFHSIEDEDFSSDELSVWMGWVKEYEQMGAVLVKSMEEAVAYMSANGVFSCDGGGDYAACTGHNVRYALSWSDDHFDFRQNFGPCVDQGMSVSGLTEDYAGDTVPWGNGPDIGPHEFYWDHAVDIPLRPVLTGELDHLLRDIKNG